jgi:hypothetical protein
MLDDALFIARQMDDGDQASSSTLSGYDADVSAVSTRLA